MENLTCSWLAPPEIDAREVDPIGLSSLHDAAAAVLLPWITNRTRSADDYLWVLSGLEAGGRLGRTDREIWGFFERFEKALKIFWYTDLKIEDGFAGVRAIEEMTKAERRDLDFVLLSNQRSNGLLGGCTSGRCKKPVWWKVAHSLFHPPGESFASNVSAVAR